MTLRSRAAFLASAATTLQSTCRCPCSQFQCWATGSMTLRSRATTLQSIYRCPCSQCHYWATQHQHLSLRRSRNRHLSEAMVRHARRCWNGKGEIWSKTRRSAESQRAHRGGCSGGRGSLNPSQALEPWRTPWTMCGFSAACFWTSLSPFSTSTTHSWASVNQSTLSRVIWNCPWPSSTLLRRSWIQIKWLVAQHTGDTSLCQVPLLPSALL